MSFSQYSAVVIGVSAGGLNALKIVLNNLPETFPIPIIIVQHVSPNMPLHWVDNYSKYTDLDVKEAEFNEVSSGGTIYFAPPNYHLLIEDDGSFSLSVDERVHYARPSIDVFFESAADVWKEKLIGIILTGANTDGAQGLLFVKKKGGLTIVQDPSEAEVNTMPLAAIKEVDPELILKLKSINDLLLKISNP